MFSSGIGSIASYDNLEQVGEGTYGYVYRARDKRNGEIVALKRLIIHKENSGFPLCAVREIKFLKSLQHKNIVKLRDMATSKGCENLDTVIVPDPSKAITAAALAAAAAAVGDKGMITSSVRLFLITVLYSASYSSSYSSFNLMSFPILALTLFTAIEFIDTCCNTIHLICAAMRSGCAPVSPSVCPSLSPSVCTCACVCASLFSAVLLSSPVCVSFQASMFILDTALKVGTTTVNHG